MTEGKNEKAEKKKRLAEVAAVFLKLGCIGFGGPAVHIAMMEEEVVRRRQWLTPEHFIDLVGATNLIPGPNSTEMTMHCGHERAGRAGLVVAGICFILPAVLITGALAWAYAEYGQLPRVQPFVYGIQPAIMAILLSLVISLGRKAWKSLRLGLLGIAAAVLALLGWNEIALLFGGGALAVALSLLRQAPAAPAVFFPLLLRSASGMDTASPRNLFWIFLKVGAILYGSGYVLFAFLDAELVQRGWLSRQELIDAIAVGQFTPGPVFSSATFIGWQMAGWPGAVAATLGIFLPSFLFVALLNPLIPKLRRSKIMSVFLDAVNIISVGLILAVCVETGAQAFNNWRTMVIAGVAFAASLLFPKMNSAFTVLGGALLGYLLWWL